MEVWTMRFSSQLVIDAACALIVVALLFVPMLATRSYQPQAKNNANVHRITASATHLRATRPVNHVAPAN
jgi:hypothetical protein